MIDIGKVTVRAFFYLVLMLFYVLIGAITPGDSGKLFLVVMSSIVYCEISFYILDKVTDSKFLFRNLFFKWILYLGNVLLLAWVVNGYLMK